MIRSGEVEPAFAMYARFQQRNRERIEHALQLLSAEPDMGLRFYRSVAEHLVRTLTVQTGRGERI